MTNIMTDITKIMTRMTTKMQMVVMILQRARRCTNNCGIYLFLFALFNNPNALFVFFFDFFAFMSKQGIRHTK